MTSWPDWRTGPRPSAAGECRPSRSCGCESRRGAWRPSGRPNLPPRAQRRSERRAESAENPCKRGLKAGTSARAAAIGRRGGRATGRRPTRRGGGRTCPSPGGAPATRRSNDAGRQSAAARPPLEDLHVRSLDLRAALRSREEDVDRKLGVAVQREGETEPLRVLPSDAAESRSRQTGASAPVSAERRRPIRPRRTRTSCRRPHSQAISRCEPEPAGFRNSTGRPHSQSPTGACVALTAGA